MMHAVVFSWSGSFRDRYGERAESLQEFVSAVRDRGFAVGIVADEPRDVVAEAVAELDLDVVIGDVENIIEVLSGLTGRYDKVFFVSDVLAELAAVNQSGAFTVGLNTGKQTADELGGIGPNYIVDTLDELEKILSIEE